MAETTSTTFSRTTTVQKTIQAKPEIIWSLLTDAREFPRWNSTIVRIEGQITKGNTIKLTSTLDPKRVFSLIVAQADVPNSMIWKSGQAPFFQGVRTFSLQKTMDGSILFTMTEKLSGLMFPLASGSIPDFKESFEQFALDLKQESEKRSGN